MRTVKPPAFTTGIRGCAARLSQRAKTGTLGDTGVSTSRTGLVPPPPDGERLVAYLERRTPWDS